jgi:hypothetical protein
VHQKRKSVGEPWEDEEGSTLQQTAPLTPSRFPLDSAETKALFDRLTDLYQIGEGGVQRGRVVVELANADEIIKIDASRASLIKKLLESNHGEEVWRLLLELEPDLVTKLAGAKLHSERRQAITEFETAIEAGELEEYWRKFLIANQWMFGGSNVAVIQEGRIDIKTTADIPFEVEGGFMDIVELKRPDFPFWARTKEKAVYKYRKKYPIPSSELQGAIAQVTDYIVQAEKKLSDADFIKQHGVRPLKPRGLVVHGRSNDWGQEEWDAFRLLNDNLHGVQVMTFDHLLAQGRHALGGSLPKGSDADPVLRNFD